MTHNRGHILVVDDNRMNRLKLARSLQKQGHTAALAENGRQALDMIQAESFDLVLLDIVMPELDGYQVLEHIKHDSALRDVPVIVVSAVDEMESVVKCVRMGAEDYLPKPFDPLLLQARIGACLGEKQLRDKLTLLNQVGQELTATLDLPRVVERLLKAVTEIVGAEGSLVWLRDKEEECSLVCQTTLYRGHKGSPPNLRLPFGQGIAGWVAETGKSIAVPHAPDDSRFFPGVDEQTGLDTTSLLAAPLWARDTVIGVLEVVNKLDGEFDKDDGVLVETLAASAAIALDNAGLVEALRQRTLELEARNEELDAFAHTVAHDLKNPLTVISGFTSVLKRSFAKLPEAKLRKRLNIIAQHGRRMNNIIDELLLLASVRKEEVTLYPLDMARIVAEAQARLAYSIEEHQAEITLPETWPAALGYGPWVEEVWVNYLSNALKYGGRPPHIVLGSSPSLECPHGRAGEQRREGTEEGLIRFWIRDNGPGLTPEEQARLFTPFTRLDQVRAKGHGLGLSIVRRIVEKMGGQVGVESEVREGSVFSFTLPGAPVDGG